MVRQAEAAVSLSEAGARRPARGRRAVGQGGAPGWRGGGGRRWSVTCRANWMESLI